MDVASSGLTGLGASDINKMISYIDGTKSTVSAMRLKSVGKNLLPTPTGAVTHNGVTAIAKLDGA